MEIKHTKVRYDYNGVSKGFTLIECDRQITTICEVIENEDGSEFDIKVVSPGMTYAELVELFPPDQNSIKAGMDFCLLQMIRSIIWEAHRDLGTSYEGGNVRHFWYSHLKYVIEDILKLGETSSVAGAINTAWANLVDSGLITYEGMNIVSAKENVRRSFIRDSPFSNMLIAVEKENLFEEFQWIPELFNSTLITAGGQPSRSVSRSYARQLVGELQASGVDVDKDIFMCTISDLDPAGYYIQEAFKNQIEKALEYYGSNAEVHIRRLFVKPEQVSDNLLQHKAMKCEDVGAENERAKKAENTKWAYFCEQTRTAKNPAGGLYKIEGGKKYRAKLELDAFPNSFIERNILNELLLIIRDISDESLIMIPEVMRIFFRVGRDVVEQIFKRHKADWLAPIIKEYLSIADEYEHEFEVLSEQERSDENARYDEVADPIKEEYQMERDESEELADEEEAEQQKIIDAYKKEQGHDVRQKEIEEEIKKLEAENTEIEADIEKNCADELKAIEEAWERHEGREEDIDEREEDALEEHDKEHQINLKDIDDREAYRLAKLEELKRWHEANFNPTDIELRNAVNDALSDKMDFRFRDLESDDRTKPHVAKLMTNPEALLEDETSAWEQEDYPVFTETDCLEKAAKGRNPNVEPHRRGFTPDFIDAMAVILHEAGDDVEVEYPEPPELDNLKDGFRADLDKLKETVETDIEEGKHVSASGSEEDDEEDPDDESEDDTEETDE